MLFDDLFDHQHSTVYILMFRLYPILNSHAWVSSRTKCTLKKLKDQGRKWKVQLTNMSLNHCNFYATWWTFWPSAFPWIYFDVLIISYLRKVLLLDEPTSALDPISTQNIEDVIVKLKKKEGMTIVMVSHSIKQIQRIADVVCLLVNGEIVEVLEPDKLSEAKHPMALRFLELSS